MRCINHTFSVSLKTLISFDAHLVNVAIFVNYLGLERFFGEEILYLLSRYNLTLLDIEVI